MASSQYSTDELEKLARHLVMSEVPPDIVDRLQAAAEAYQFGSMVERDPSRAERRKTLNRIAKLANELSAILSKANAETLKEISPPLNIDFLQLAAENARKAALKIPKGGGDPNLARPRFVKTLAEIWRETTGERPTRRTRTDTGQEYGPFHDFVRAALEFLDTETTKGVEHDIRAAISAMAKTAD